MKLKTIILFIILTGLSIAQTCYETDATKRSPQRWMVIVGEDSTQGLSKIWYNFEEGKTYDYYHSILQFNVNGDTVWKAGDTLSFTTLLPEPELTYVQDATNGTKLNWFDYSTDEDGFYIYANGVLVDSVATDTTNYCFDASSWISKDTTITFKVAAFTQDTIALSDSVDGTAYYLAPDSVIVIDSTVTYDAEMRFTFETDSTAIFTGGITDASADGDTLIVTTARKYEGNKSLLAYTNADNDLVYGSVNLPEAHSTTDTTWISFYLYMQSGTGSSGSSVPVSIYGLGNIGRRTLAMSFMNDGGTPAKVYDGRWETYATADGFSTWTATNGWMHIIAYRVPPTTDASNDGKLGIYVDGVLKSAVTNDDGAYTTSIIPSTVLLMGKVIDVGTNTTNDSLYIDDFRLARDSASLFSTTVTYDTTWEAGDGAVFSCDETPDYFYLLDAEGKIIYDADNNAILKPKE